MNSAFVGYVELSRSRRVLGIGLVCTQKFSFHEFYNFLLFNFLISIFLEDIFLPTTFTYSYTHDPHPRPTTFSYTQYYLVNRRLMIPYKTKT